MKFKKWLSCILACLLLAGCSSNEPTKTEDISDWDQVLKNANGTTVTFYGWGGSPQVNQWVEDELAKSLKSEYNITLKRVGMDIDAVLNQLVNEKTADVSKGNMDVIWINGENFYNAKKNQLLFGPFTDNLPRYNANIDVEAIENKYDFGHLVEGYESPFGKAQFVMTYDSQKIPVVPIDSAALLTWAKENPGKFTYPAPPDFTGSAFIRNIICDIVGYETFLEMEADEETVRKSIEPAIKYLKELNPYLWKGGRTYPAEIALLDNLYADGEVWMTMNYNPNDASSKIDTGEFVESTRTFVFEKGTLGNTHFLAIPFNAPNKEGAMAVIDYILSAEMQASKYDPENWGDLPVVDYNKITDEQKDMLNKVPQGKATLNPALLAEKRIPEMPAKLVPIIEKIWMENFAEGIK